MNHMHSPNSDKYMADFTKQAQPQSFITFFIKESIHELSNTW